MYVILLSSVYLTLFDSNWYWLALGYNPVGEQCVQHHEQCSYVSNVMPCIGRLQLYTHRHTSTHTHIHTQTHTDTHTHAHAHTDTRTHAHTHTIYIDMYQFESLVSSSRLEYGTRAGLRLVSLSCKYS